MRSLMPPARFLPESCLRWDVPTGFPVSEAFCDRAGLGFRLAAPVAALPQRDRELVALRHAAGPTPAAIARSWE